MINTILIFTVVFAISACDSSSMGNSDDHGFMENALTQGLAIKVDDLPLSIQMVVRNDFMGLKNLAGKNKDYLNESDSYGQTAIFYALDYKRLSFVKYLMDVGVNISATTVDGETVLMRAVSSGNKGYVMALLEKYSSINAVDKMGRSALHFAAVSQNAEIFHILIRKGADCHLRDNKGMTPALISEYLGNEALVKFCDG